MTQEFCGPCKEAGFSILAAYKGVPKGMSHDGKDHPPVCSAHRRGETPRWIREAVEAGKLKIPTPMPATSPKPLNMNDYKTVSDAVAAQAPQKPETIIRRGEEVSAQRTYPERLCSCGCGEKFVPTGPAAKFISGHRPKNADQPKKKAAIVPEPKPPMPGAVVIPSLAAELAKLKAKLTEELAAVTRVEEMLAEKP